MEKKKEMQSEQVISSFLFTWFDLFLHVFASVFKCLDVDFFFRYFHRRSLAAFFLTFLQKFQLFSCFFLSFSFIYLLRSFIYSYTHMNVINEKLTGKRIRNHITAQHSTQRNRHEYVMCDLMFSLGHVFRPTQ